MLTGLGRQAALTINTKAANCCDTYCAGYGTESGCNSQFLRVPNCGSLTCYSCTWSKGPSDTNQVYACDGCSNNDCQDLSCSEPSDWSALSDR